MHSDLVEAGWTEDHWNRIVSAVTEEAQRARIAAQMLPLIGPEDRSAVAFADYTIGDEQNPLGTPPRRLTTENLPNHYFTTIAAQVQLSTSEVADGALEAALVKFRRAANIVARVEDLLMFNDRNPQVGLNALATLPAVFQITGGGPPPPAPFEFGLVPLDNGAGRTTAFGGRHRVIIHGPFQPPLIDVGERVVAAIVQAMSDLERAGQSRPFACALSPYLFEAVYTPNGNFVAAKDRILPILNGPLLRTSALIDTDLNNDRYPYGVVVALGGNPVAIRVGSDIGIRYLQSTGEPRYLFRVSERIGLRMTDPRAVAVLTPP
jgi:hypothetical protein